MILHFDFSTGASGDKLLGALLEVSETLGTASFADVERIGTALVPDVRIERTRMDRGGIQGTGITVTEHDAPVRHWHEIRSLIENAGNAGTLPKDAAALARSAFETIARAEANVHGCAVEHVHFHEVGAADSIIDICCSSFLLTQLRPEAVFATPLALGSGSFTCSHGEMSVPAPATARLIEGLPVYAGPHDGELTTPTGAALARAFVSAWEPLPCMRPVAVGYGVGSRVIPGAPNVVRALAGATASLAGLRGSGSGSGSGDTDDSGSGDADGDDGGTGAKGSDSGVVRLSGDDNHGAGTDVDTDAKNADGTAGAFALEGCALLETNIDHLSPEALAFACEELLASGALDVWQEPIVMKKGRLAVRLCVLTPAGMAQGFAERVIALTGSLGVRSSAVERLCAPRETIAQDTPYGTVVYKTAHIATPDGRIKLQRPEYEDIARIARQQGLDFNALYEELAGRAASD
jgi:uncharacterized protein (TIGR00299 family) protein